MPDEKQELIDVQPTAIQPVEPGEIIVSPDAPLVVQIAQMMQKGVNFDADQMGKMQEIANQQEDRQSKAAFNVAMAAFKKNPPKLLKDKLVEYTNSKGETTSYKHAELATVARVLDEALGEHDLSFRWKIEDMEKGLIKVSCILTHILGHSESADMSSLPDASGGKNAVQAKGSALSYLQRYTLKSVCGLAEEGKDNDGITAADQVPMIAFPTDLEWECIDGIIAALPPEPVIDRDKLAQWFLADGGKYPCTISRVPAAAEHVHQKAPDNIYADTPAL